MTDIFERLKEAQTLYESAGVNGEYGSGLMIDAQARIAQLEAALAWYGEQVYLYANDTTEKADEADVALDQDGGKRARAALKAKP